LLKSLRILIKDIKDNGVAMGNTASYYNKQIALLQKTRDKVALTREATMQYNEAIDQVRKHKEALSAPMADTLEAYRKEIQELRKMQRATANTAESYDEFEKKIAAVKKNVDNLTGSQRNQTKTNQDMISNAGLAGATLTELGRTISDSNYGIRGMANNLSQLSTLFITLVAKVDGGFGPALSMLGKQLFGPLGIILAFQSLVAMLERFAMESEEAKRASQEAAEAISEEVVILEGLVERLNSAIEGSAEYEAAVLSLSKAHKELGEELLRNNITYDEQKKIIQDYLELKQIENEIDIVSEQLKKRFNETEADRKKSAEIIPGLQEKINSSQALYNAYLEDESDKQNSVKAYRSRAAEEGIRLRRLVDQLAFHENRLNEITGERTELNEYLIQQYKDLEEIEKKRDLNRRLNADRTVEFWQDEIKRIQEVRDSTSTTAEEYKSYSDVIAVYQAEIDKIQGKSQEDFLEGYRAIFKELEFIDKDRFEKRRIQARQEYQEYLSNLDKEVEGKMLTSEQIKEIDRLKNAAYRVYIAEKKSIDDDEIDYRTKNIEKMMKAHQKGLDQEKRDFIAASNQKVKDIDLTASKERNTRAEAILRELKDKEDQVEAIKKLDIEIAESKIIMYQVLQRAGEIDANIAETQIEKLRGSIVKLKQGLTGEEGGYTLDQAVQDFQKSMSIVSDTVQAPDFNIVGASGTSQLAQAVSGQLDKPVKAYIVAKDVSTAQEMDRNKIEAASL
jgi:hypothetical protein